jgi:hypothetical protein
MKYLKYLILSNLKGLGRIPNLKAMCTTHAYLAYQLLYILCRLLETRPKNSQVFNKCTGCNFTNSKKDTNQGLFENETCTNFKKGVRGVGHFFPREVGRWFDIIFIK